MFCPSLVRTAAKARAIADRREAANEAYAAFERRRDDRRRSDNFNVSLWTAKFDAARFKA